MTSAGHYLDAPADAASPEAQAQWYRKVVQTERTTHSIRVKDSVSKYYSWAGGQPCGPTLLFIHGSFANSHWWDHIAPMFCDRFRCLALDLSGMGESEHRRQYYTPELFAEEIETVIADAAADGKTVLIGHSFGGSMARIAAARNNRKLLGLVLVDPSRSRFFHLCESDSWLLRWQHADSYRSQSSAMRRFRLQPHAGSTPLHVRRYLAEQSVRQVGDRWRWKSDPQLLTKVVGLETTQDEQIRTIVEMSCNVGVICGERSHVYRREFLQQYLPDDLNVAIPRADHHVFLDQPFTFAKVLNGMLSRWQLQETVATAAVQRSAPPMREARHRD